MSTIDNYHVRYGLRQLHRHQAMCDRIKLESGCVDCGYAERAVVLEFDHLPGFEKKFVIGQAANRSRDAVLREIAKCEVVCCNCHRIRTYDRGQMGKPTTKISHTMQASFEFGV